jgi:hypothetical protein
MTRTQLRVLMESRMRRRVASPVRRAAARKPPAERPHRRLAADPTHSAGSGAATNDRISGGCDCSIERSVSTEPTPTSKHQMRGTGESQGWGVVTSEDLLRSQRGNPRSRPSIFRLLWGSVDL